MNDYSVNNSTSGANVFISYIDELARATSETYTAVYTAGTRNLVVLVRDGGSTPIKQFISSWTFTSSGQTLNAIRTSDT